MRYLTPFLALLLLAPAVTAQDQGVLPNPDILVTDSRWDVFLPVGPRYYDVDSTMDLIQRGRLVNPRVAGGEVLARASDAYQAQMGQPLRITVPTQGIQFAFEKLYANQSEDEAAFSLNYVSAEGGQLSLLASAAGTLLLWLGIAGLASRRVRLPRSAAIVCVVLGGAVVLATIGFLGTNPVVASALSLLMALLLALWAAVNRWRDWRRNRLAA